MAASMLTNKTLRNGEVLELYNVQDDHRTQSIYRIMWTDHTKMKPAMLDYKDFITEDAARKHFDKTV